MTVENPVNSDATCADFVDFVFLNVVDNEITVNNEIIVCKIKKRDRKKE